MKRTQSSRIQTTPDSKQKQKGVINKRIFSQNFPIVGDVPIAFFIPD
jgi:hypothetical protein